MRNLLLFLCMYAFWLSLKGQADSANVNIYGYRVSQAEIQTILDTVYNNKPIRIYFDFKRNLVVSEVNRIRDSISLYVDLNTRFISTGIWNSSHFDTVNFDSTKNLVLDNNLVLFTSENFGSLRFLYVLNVQTGKFISYQHAALPTHLIFFPIYHDKIICGENFGFSSNLCRISIFRIGSKKISLVRKFNYPMPLDYYVNSQAIRNTLNKLKRRLIE